MVLPGFPPSSLTLLQPSLYALSEFSSENSIKTHRSLLTPRPQTSPLPTGQQAR